MKKQTIISGTVGLIIGTVIGSMFLTDGAPELISPIEEVNIGPSPINAVQFFAAKQISDSLLLPYPRHTVGVLYDIDKLHHLTQKLSALKKRYDVNNRDSVLQYAIYPLQTTPAHNIN